MQGAHQRRLAGAQTKLFGLGQAIAGGIDGAVIGRPQGLEAAIRALAGQGHPQAIGSGPLGRIDIAQPGPLGSTNKAAVLEFMTKRPFA